MITLTWEKISYSIMDSSIKDGRRVILDNLTGSVCSGNFLAILGSSGSGKSCFLSSLCNRLKYNKGARLSGSVDLNGSSVFENESFQKNSAYMMQSASLFLHLTVHNYNI